MDEFWPRLHAMWPLGLATGLPGDHRTAWIDLPLREVLGYSPPDLHRVYPPDIVVSDPRVVTKHNARLIKLPQEARTDTKAATLRSMVQSTLASPDDPPHSLADIDTLHFKINQERRDLGRKAAKGLQKRHTGAHPFSPKTQRLLTLAMLWSKVVVGFLSLQAKRAPRARGRAFSMFPHTPPTACWRGCLAGEELSFLVKILT